MTNDPNPLDALVSSSIDEQLGGWNSGREFFATVQPPGSSGTDSAADATGSAIGAEYQSQADFNSTSSKA